MIKKIFFVFLPLLLIGCASTGGISDFYKSNYSDNELPSECYLKEGEEPEVYYSTNISDDINLLKSNYYQILGYSTFNGPAQGEDLTQNVKNMCKLKKAQIGLYNYEYTDTRNGWTQYGVIIKSCGLAKIV